MTFKEWVATLPGDSDRCRREWLAQKLCASLSAVNSWWYAQRTPGTAMIARMRDMSDGVITFETFHPEQKKGEA